MCPRRFVITGVTLTGNMGGSAMLYATLQQLRSRYPDSQFQLLSIYPEADRRCNVESDLRIVDAKPLQLLGWYMPLTLLAALGHWIRNILSHRIGFFKALDEADAVIDLSGISFVDGRGVALLWYNLSCALPGIVWGKPVFKLSQALGPFQTTLNRLIAKPLLEHCAVVVARGEQSYQFLNDLGLSKSIALPDVSFTLNVGADCRRRAKEILSSLSRNGKSWVIVSPSRVVANLCVKRGIDFLGEMRGFVENLLQDEGINVLILPHSLGKGNSKNNDIDLCRDLYHCLNGAERVYLYIPDEDPVLLRALIGQAAFFIGCRFHAVVAALSASVPTLILGWSHKYREMAKSFNADISCFDFSSLSSDALTEAFRKAWQIRHETHARLSANGEFVRSRAAQNYDLVENYLRQSDASE